MCDIRSCAPGATGICRDIPTCGTGDPVCSCDGTIYSNDCYRLAAAAPLNYYGDGVCLANCYDAYEPNDQPWEANSLDADLSSPNHQAIRHGYICSPTDVDLFYFTVSPTGTLYVLATWTSCAYADKLRVAVWDATLTVQYGTGADLSCGEVYWAGVPSPGRFYVKVDGPNRAMNGYTIKVYY